MSIQVLIIRIHLSFEKINKLTLSSLALHCNFKQGSYQAYLEIEIK